MVGAPLDEGSDPYGEEQRRDTWSCLTFLSKVADGRGRDWDQGWASEAVRLYAIEC